MQRYSPLILNNMYIPLCPRPPPRPHALTLFLFLSLSLSSSSSSSPSPSLVRTHVALLPWHCSHLYFHSQEGEIDVAKSELSAAQTRCAGEADLRATIETDYEARIKALQTDLQVGCLSPLALPSYILPSLRANRP